MGRVPRPCRRATESIYCWHPGARHIPACSELQPSPAREAWVIAEAEAIVRAYEEWVAFYLRFDLPVPERMPRQLVRELARIDTDWKYASGASKAPARRPLSGISERNRRPT
jgi:hypothetical protein